PARPPGEERDAESERHVQQDVRDEVAARRAVELELADDARERARVERERKQRAVQDQRDRGGEQPNVDATRTGSTARRTLGHDWGAALLASSSRGSEHL